jgi:hypothetical protein
MPDQLDPSIDELAAQRQMTHATPQTGMPGTLQGSIEESGHPVPSWVSGVNEWLSKHQGLTNAIKEFSEGIPGPTELGMYKFVPVPHSQHMLDWFQRMKMEPSYMFKVLNHEDEHVVDLQNVRVSPNGKIKLDMYGAYGRQSKYPPGHPAREANRLSHTFEPEELAEMARAALREFPGAKTAEGMRISGARTGPAASGKRPPQIIPLQRLISRYPEQFPPMSQDPNMFPDNQTFSEQLLDLALQSIKEPKIPPPAPKPPPRPPDS